MANKLSDEKINQIREMRAKKYSVGFIADALSISAFVVQRYTKDMGICLRNKKDVMYVHIPAKDAFPCHTYSFSELNEEDQKKYLDCKPATKEDKTFITAKKEAYSKADVYDMRRSKNRMEALV